MDLIENEGQHPSLLELDRYHCGELSDDEVAVLLPRLGDREHAHLSALEAQQGNMPALDMGALRSRAQPSVHKAPPALPVPSNQNRWFGAVGLLAAAFLAFFLMQGPTEPGADGVRFRGGAVQMFTLGHDKLVAWDGDAVGEGTVVGFQVNGTGHEGVVLLSIDGDGAASVLWPESGVGPEPLHVDGMTALPGTLTLDNAPGPEVFVAVYNVGTPGALQEARGVYRAGGIEGLQAWADSDGDVDLLIVPRLR